MTAQLSIPARYNGPPTSGNGGYSCGVLAAHVSGPARVRLHVPPPLDTVMEVRHSDAGKVELYEGDTLVGTAAPCTLELAIPQAPSLAQAEAARERFPCYEGHTFDTCFVCGPARPAHDGMEIFPGPVSDWQLLACPWYPREDFLDARGCIREEILWSALDCPGFFAGCGEELRPAVLGQLEGELREPVKGTDPLIVYAWPLGGEGRKIYAGTAIARQDGTVVACSHSTWIVLTQ